MKSIESKLNTGLGLSLLLVFAVIGAGVSVSMRVLMESRIETRLAQDTDSLLTAITIDHSINPPAITLRPERVGPVYERVFSGHYFVIETSQKRFRSRSLWDQDMEVSGAPPGEIWLQQLPGPENQSLLIRVGGYRKNGTNITIAVAEDLTPVDAYINKLQTRYGLFVIVVLLALVFIQRRILSVGLRPLEKARHEVKALEGGEREALSETVPVELHPLVHQVNQLLAVLRQRLDRSRNALGNLAHAMKTPLTLMNQYAGMPGAITDASVRSGIQSQVRNIQTLVERELKRARLSGGAGSFGRLDIRRELGSLTDVMRQIYRDKNLQIEIDIQEGPDFTADKEDMLELFGNLLDNACKWARNRVQVTARRADGLIVRIEDDGAGASETELSQLRHRGVRIDEGKVPGFGLGLAIAQDAVQFYDGKMTLGRSEQLGGFMVEVRLPDKQRV